MSNITAIDFLILIPYLALFYFFAKRLSRKITSPDLRKYFMGAFWLRMLGCIAYTLVIQFYYGYGDSITFYQGSDFITKGIMENPSNARYLVAPLSDISAWYNASPGKDDIFAQYFAQPSGNLVMKISAALSFLSFNRFLIISLFFGFFSFMGQWKLFSVFDDVNKHRNRKLLAYAVLYTPSIWFWGSGLMKDSLCLGGLGFIVNYLYHFFVKKEFSLKHLLIIAILAYVIVTIKFYIIGIFIVSVVLMLVVSFFRTLKNILLKAAFIVFMFGSVAVVLVELDVSSMISVAIEDAVAQIQMFQGIYEAAAADDEGSKGSFSIGEVSPTIGGIIAQAPAVVFSCLYRPFIWESRKVMIFFTSLESLLLLICTFYLLLKTKVIGFFKHIFANEFVFFSFVLSILFAMVIGFTTFNFGTMIRYKIIFLPFFYFMLVHIYTFAVQKQKA